jgi:hypothetical protein
MAPDPHPHLTCRWEKPVDWDLLDVPNVPNEPGFYAFTDYGDEALQPTPAGKSVMYVGIATGSLRRRLQRYKRGDTTGLTNLHRGGLLLLSRAAAVHVDETKRVTQGRTRCEGYPHTLE